MKTVSMILLLSACWLPAQTITVNGSDGHALVPVGSVVTFQFQGTPGLPLYWAFSLGSGPTQLGSQVIGIDVTDMTEIAQGLLMPPGGIIAFSVPVPASSLLSGTTFYSAALQLDPGHPDGFVVSNSISFTLIVPGADAGPDGSALAGESLALDGSANRDPSGVIPAGTSLLWVVVEAPPSSLPIIENETGEFATFRADVPGAYSIELQTTSASGFSADLMVVDVYEVAFSSPVNGSFATGPVSVAGNVAGPGSFTLAVNGTTMPIVGSGGFTAGSVTPTQLVNPVTAQVTTPSGLTLEKTVVVIGGTAAPLGTPAAPGGFMRLQGASLDALEIPLELALGLVPLGTAITALPPLPLINTPPLFTSTVSFTQASYDPLVDVDLFPSNNNIGISITLTNLVILADVTGVLLFIPYAETATITASSVVITGDLVISANATGGATATVTNSTAILNNYQFTATGVLAGVGQLATIQASTQVALETIFASVLDLIPALLTPMLSGLTGSSTLTAQGVSIQTTLSLNTVLYDLNGMTLATDFVAAAMTIDPLAPQPAGYLTTPSTGLPTFGLMTPVTGSAFDAALGINDDLINQTFAELSRAGAMQGEADGNAMPGLTAGAMDLLFPGAGFELFDPADPVVLAYRASTSPVVEFNLATGAATASLQIGNLEIDVLVDHGGVRTPLVLVDVTVISDLLISFDPVTSNLIVVSTVTSITPTLRGAMAGRDPGPALAAMGGLVQTVLNLITAPLNSLPLPSPALGLAPGTVTEISVTTAAPDILSIYLDMP